MKTLLTVLGFAGLFAPYLWELRDDRYGDDAVITLGRKKIAEKSLDVVLRGILAFVAAQFNFMVCGANLYTSLLVALAIHFLLFDPSINVVLGKPEPLKYLGKKSVFDNLKAWNRLHWVVRLLIRFAVFVLSLYVYLSF